MMIRIGVKIALFTMFLALIYFVGDYFLNLLRSYVPAGGLIGGNILPLACQMGVFTGINIFISIMLTAFVVKSIMRYIESL